MNKTWLGLVLWAGVILLIIAGLLHLAGTPKGDTPPEIPVQDTQEIPPLDLTMAQDSQGRPVFAFSLETFLASYNGLWQEDLLPPAHLWTKSASLSQEETSVGDCYSASPDPEVWFLPTLSAYTRAGDPAIWKISVEMDEHSDSPEKSGLFQEMSLCALSLFFPDLPEEARESLFLELDRQAYDGRYTGIYHADLIPHVLYHQDGIGVFPFFALGEYERFTFLPVTDPLLETWANQGAQLIDLDQWTP